MSIELSFILSNTLVAAASKPCWEKGRREPIDLSIFTKLSKLLNSASISYPSIRTCADIEFGRCDVSMMIFASNVGESQIVGSSAGYDRP